jgi:Winged helix-turn-helix DNA-binding
MRVYNACGDEIPAPTGWDHDGECCAACAEAAEIAERIRIEREEERATDAALTKALTDDPTRSNAEIRKEVGVPMKDVVERRKALDLPPVKEARTSAKRQPARELLREQPDLTNQEVAKRLGVSSTTVSAARQELGLPSAKPGPKPGTRPKRATVGSNR